MAGAFTKRECVIEPVVWRKLKAIREAADIASARGCGAGRWRERAGGSPRMRALDGNLPAPYSS